MIKKIWKLTVLVGIMVLLCGCNEEKVSDGENLQITKEENRKKQMNDAIEENTNTEKTEMKDYSDNHQELKCIEVFFTEEASQKNLEQIKHTIEKKPEVAYIEEIGSEEAWKDYVNKYMQGSSSSDLENPLSDDFKYFIVYLKENADGENLVQYIEQLPYVSSCTKSK